MLSNLKIRIFDRNQKVFLNQIIYQPANQLLTEFMQLAKQAEENNGSNYIHNLNQY